MSPRPHEEVMISLICHLTTKPRTSRQSMFNYSRSFSWQGPLELPSICLSAQLVLILYFASTAPRLHTSLNQLSSPWGLAQLWPWNLTVEPLRLANFQQCDYFLSICIGLLALSLPSVELQPLWLHIAICSICVLLHVNTRVYITCNMSSKSWC